MIDIHCHILPGVDDGAKDMATALEMGRIAQRNGTKSIIATPHVIGEEFGLAWPDIIERCRQLEQEFHRQAIKVAVRPGAEVALSMDILSKLDGPGDYCLNGGKYMLVELPAREMPSFTDEFFFHLQTKGICPILAHPERHPAIANNPDMLLSWLNKGILLQVNGSSITGLMGERVKRIADLLLANNLVHFVGSDAHSIHRRTPDITEALSRTEQYTDREQTERLVVDYPQYVMNSEDIEPIDIPDHIRLQRQSWLGRFFNKIYRVS